MEHSSHKAQIERCCRHSWSHRAFVQASIVSNVSACQHNVPVVSGKTLTIDKPLEALMVKGKHISSKGKTCDRNRAVGICSLLRFSMRASMTSLAPPGWTDREYACFLWFEHVSYSSQVRITALSDSIELREIFCELRVHQLARSKKKHP